MTTKYRRNNLKRFYLQEWLRDTGISQQELANMLDESKVNINRWIAEPWRVNISILTALVEALDLRDVGELFVSPAVAKRRRARLDTMEQPQKADRGERTAS